MYDVSQCYSIQDYNFSSKQKRQTYFFLLQSLTTTMIIKIIFVVLYIQVVLSESAYATRQV